MFTIVSCAHVCMCACVCVLQAVLCHVRSGRSKRDLGHTVAPAQTPLALLFPPSDAWQVMYAYVMRPETLPASYNKFIVNTGPIDKVVLSAVRDQIRGAPVDIPQARAVQRVCMWN